MFSCPHCHKKFHGPSYQHFVFAEVYKLGNEVGWNRTLMSEKLGIALRTLRDWLRAWKSLGIDIPDSHRQNWRSNARKMR